MGDLKYTRNLFLRGMSVVYLFAFASLYVQIPGLYGKNGILPAKTQFEDELHLFENRMIPKPSLLLLAPDFGLDTDYMMDFLAVIGTFLSFVGFVWQKFCTAPLFLALWALYQSLYQVGQDFMANQWDMLLLETGFLLILLAPITDAKGKTPPHVPLLFWMLRWLLFRLKFSAGVSKLSSRSAVWWRLTGFKVHLQAQCLPTPLAWYMYQLPLWVLKYCMVATYVIEIGIPFLFFFPHRRVRVCSFYLQIFLQCFEMLTGNCNFMGLLTIMLCLSLLDDEFFYKQNSKDPSIVAKFINLFDWLLTVAVYGSVFYVSHLCFPIKKTLNRSFDIKIGFSNYQFETALGAVLPKFMIFGWFFFTLIIVETLTNALLDERGILHKIFSFIVTFWYCGTAFLLFGISLVPLATLHPAGSYALQSYPQFETMYKATEHMKITNPYGYASQIKGVNGRPEIVLEGSNSESGPWLEYNFLYKPGRVNSSLTFVAPYQPRLDWQMWVIAEGKYQDHPWFVSFVYRILEGQSAVLRLLDKHRNPFPNGPPKYLKASLYSYNYTKWPHIFSSSWWTRERLGEYLPVVSRENAPIIKYLKMLRIIGREDEPITNKHIKKFLDALRMGVSYMEGSVLMFSLLCAGWAIIATKRK